MNQNILEENIAFVRGALPYFYGRRQSPPPSQTLIDQANAHFQKLADAAKVARYDKLADAEKILSTGRFKAIMEREQERATQGRDPVLGLEYAQRRRIAERKLFGIEETVTDDRPLYGVLSNQDDPVARRYGDVKFIFRDAVRPVGTMMRGDSFNAVLRLPDFDPKNGLLAAVPLNAVSIEALGSDLAYSSFRLEDLLHCVTMDELRGALGIDYFEVQLHAAIGVSSVERILVKPGMILSKRAQQWAESQQIPIAPLR